MTRRRHFSILLLLSLCLQCVLSAQAIACVAGSHDGAASAMSDAASMAGMDMRTESAVPSSCGRTPGAPCDGPVSSPECQPFAACAPVVLPGTSGTLPSAVIIPVAGVALVVLTPASWTMRPDFPPPRT